MGAVVRWVMQPEGSDIPAELHAAHVCDQFHCTPAEYERQRERYDLWFALMNQERMAAKLRDDGWKDIPTAWQREYEEFIPDGLEMDQLREIKRNMAAGPE